MKTEMPLGSEPLLHFLHFAQHSELTRDFGHSSFSSVVYHFAALLVNVLYADHSFKKVQRKCCGSIDVFVQVICYRGTMACSRFLDKKPVMELLKALQRFQVSQQP